MRQTKQQFAVIYAGSVWEVFSGWSPGCDEGAEVTGHKEWSQNIRIHSDMSKSNIVLTFLS